MKAVFILLDSLNRRYLQLYNSSARTLTPNFERLAERGCVFENHWCGSAPCMPARREMLTGRINFMERPWGGIEPFDCTLPQVLKTKNVWSTIEADHFNYGLIGGENYMNQFTSFDLHRGAEHDTINYGPDATGIPEKKKPEGHVGSFDPAYEKTRAVYANDKDKYNTSRTLQASADWLEKYHDSDNFLLWAEGFAPHEPFDAPEEFLKLYGETYGSENVPDWPSYAPDCYTEEERVSFRNRYMALLTMADYYVGKILDVLDRHDMWKDTMVILTTDHGFMLGEHGFWAKNYMPDYNEVYHLPMIAAVPGVKGGQRTKALTQNIDLLPTMMEYFGVSESALRNPIHGKSWLPVVTGAKEKTRDAVIFGEYAKSASVTDGRYVYTKEVADKATNEPLYLYGSMLTVLNQSIGNDTMSNEEMGEIMPGSLPYTKMPVWKIPAHAVHWHSGSQAFDKINRYCTEDSRLYDLETDYAEEHPLNDPALEEKMKALLIEYMEKHDAPKEQFRRLGLR